MDFTVILLLNYGFTKENSDIYDILREEFEI